MEQIIIKSQEIIKMYEDIKSGNYDFKDEKFQNIMEEYKIWLNNQSKTTNTKNNLFVENMFENEDNNKIVNNFCKNEQKSNKEKKSVDHKDTIFIYGIFNLFIVLRK
jgi:hypothetical protein